MTAAQLRNSILQEAISGHLIPNVVDEEPGSLLLEKIFEEKKRLVREKKIKAKDIVSVPVSEDEIPFEVPNNWAWCRIQDIQYLLTDGTHNRPTYTSSGVPFVSVKDMSKGYLDLSGTKYISSQAHMELSKRCNPKRGDLLLSKVGTTGVPVIVETDEQFSLFVSVALIKFFSQFVVPKFLVHLINSPLVQSQVQEHTRGVGNKNWVLNDIANTIIVLPPLEEQKRIVAKLEELLPIVEQYGKAQSELDRLNNLLPVRLRNSILQEAMQGKLVPQNMDEEAFAVHDTEIIARKQDAIKAKLLKKKDAEIVPITDDEIPFEIPVNWKWYRLQDLANMYTGDSINAEQKLKYYTNVKGMEYIGTKDVKFNHEIDYANGVAIPGERREKFRIAPANSILLCVEGGSAGRKIGTIDRDVCFGNKLCCFATYYDINRYLYYYLQSPMFKDVFRNSITGIIGGVAVNTLRHLLVPMPPVEEQERIVRRIEEIFAEMKFSI